MACPAVNKIYAGESNLEVTVATLWIQHLDTILYLGKKKLCVYGDVHSNP